MIFVGVVNAIKVDLSLQCTGTCHLKINWQTGNLPFRNIQLCHRVFWILYRQCLMMHILWVSLSALSVLFRFSILMLIQLLGQILHFGQGQDLYKSKQVRDKQIARVLGKVWSPCLVPTIAAAAYLRLAGRPPVLPSSNLSYAENFLYMLDSLGNRAYKPNPRLARVLDILFILHAEHEMNCSTSAARHLASSGVDVYTALAGAVGALYGPLHGGANEAVLKMLSEIGKVENIPDFIEGVKNRKRKMSGFGHRVYKNYDPRAKVIKTLADEVFSIVGRDPLIEVAVALEKAALSDEYFVKRKLYPNVDFYSGLIYRAMGFPTEFFPVLFAIPRMAGYLAHWRESLDDPDTKIMRPQQASSREPHVYVGEWLRRYAPVNERILSPETDRLGQVSVSNASRRRLAGSRV
ncbi:unnamed protein product [Linum tenue]|uniref:Citrate synthase n=1 Tax=Linum tenue TaxID=586396 RepID=A0AAV0MSB5_9ROSI|nr:unnamed protein product [Linum tenue]